jgi:serine/threonine protein kinase
MRSAALASIAGMDDRRIGRYRLVRPMGVSHHAERWLALDEPTQTTHLMHWVGLGVVAEVQREQIEAVRRLVHGLREPHILPIEAIIPGTRGSSQGVWILTPYTGTQVGLVSLDQLQIDKGGTIPVLEVERAMLHLLSASEAGAAAGFVHGPISSSEVLVDRHGRLIIELYGLGRALRTDPKDVPASWLAREEARSIVALGYRLLTNSSAEGQRMRISKLIRGLPHTWDAWFDAGLSPSGGFASASEALGEIPSARGLPTAVAAPLMVKTFASTAGVPMGAGTGSSAGGGLGHG